MKPVRMALTVRYKGIVPHIESDVLVIAPDGTGKRILAVWDTGASCSCISRAVASSLRLAPIGMSRHNMAGGRVVCSDYIIDIQFEGSPSRLKDIRVSDFVGGGGIDMLIGMDIISLGDFSITNAEGRTFMPFRMPPDSRHIDYVAAAQAGI